ncbi:MAG TPA: amino acid adenylation domain-containing protein, partial [Thermoanaerobaculia bacterium]
RAALLRLAPEEHWLVLVLHHIAADGWSLGVLAGELATLYGAFAAGLPSPLAELPVQYSDFARWQRGWLVGEALAAHLAFWRQALAGAPARLQLPADRPRPAVTSFRGARVAVLAPAGLAAALRGAARQHGATLFMILLAAFDLLLERLTGQEDLVVGAAIANRERVEIEGLIGCFVNTLALRADLSARPSLGELLRQVRETSLAAYAHQDLPFEKLVEALAVERDPGTTPLFQVLLVLQNAWAAGGAPDSVAGGVPAGGAAGGGPAPLAMRPRELEIGAAKFDLTLDATETPRGLALSFELRRDLFDTATVKRLAGHYLALLAALPGDPGRRLEELPVLGAAELQQLRLEWNDTARRWGWEGSRSPAGRQARKRRGEISPAAERIHELFEWQAARRPEALAVRGQGVTLTYGELELRSNRLARALRRRGVGAETRVGLCVERSPEMVVAMLGILKAGGAYVPLDPGHPAARSALVLADSAVAVLVTEERWLAGQGVAGLGGGAGRSSAWGEEGGAGRPRIVCLDRDAARIAAEDGSPLGAAAAAPPEALAWLIYTSGSTGRPKGVAVPHRAAVNLLRALAERPGLAESDVMPALATVTFDVAGAEIYLPLAVGGRVEVVGREEAATGRRLAARLQASGVTAMHATPATWRLLLDAGWQGQPGLAAISTGEALPSELAATLLDLGVELWNLYGPTETAVYSAGAPVAGPGEPALGRPLANTTLHVADRWLAPVPVGVAGELLIGGQGVARGYWGRPELTAERFVPDPWSGGEGGGRLYRTGDLVRRRHDGELECLGRIDHQVKVRGVRIEPREVEAALERHPAVARAVVVAAGDGAGRRLVAYLATLPARPVPPALPALPALPAPPALPESPRRPRLPPRTAAGEGEDAGLDAAALRAFVRRLLPDSMVPSAFVLLDRLPLTPSGKVDRRALPAPAWGAPAGGAARAAPSTPAEESVARLWAEVLGVGEVGRDDNFFDLGGHSLLLARLHVRLENLLGREISLLDLFLHPTVRAQAEHLWRAEQAAAATAPAVGQSPAPPPALPWLPRPPRPSRRARRSRPPRPSGPAHRSPARIAIVGMAGRFPGARDVEELWQHLRDGVDCIYRFGDEELLAAGVEPALLRHPRYVKAGGMIDGEELFDAAFFDYAPREAELIDPQHRLFLECAYEALERAGHHPERFRGPIGVYAGTGHPGYFLHHLAGHPALLATVGERAASLGNSLDYLTTRVSYKLNLRGPSVDLQTACSTSLVAVHLACQALQAGDCDLALAGGAELRVPQRQGYLHEEGGVESASGVCRAFDAGADGTVWGSGAGVVVLRRLAEALADGDTIHAVILGTAINNDGSGKVGFTAPSIAGQAEVIAAAQARAGCAPETIGFVECHGTGTPLGDPIEVAALARAFGTARRTGTCALGSVKTNLGHLGAAAGVAGLIKAALALERREIPASLHFTRPNPRLDLGAGP